jgi:hypothetical protein
MNLPEGTSDHPTAEMMTKSCRGTIRGVAAKVLTKTSLKMTIRTTGWFR